MGMVLVLLKGLPADLQEEFSPANAKSACLAQVKHQTP
jgi:hypothetical protein